MSENLIKTTFSIIGTLLVSLILFLIIFTADGQQFLWRAIEPALEEQWSQSSMDSGADRTEIYESQFEIYETQQFHWNNR